jgi:catechol 2,3-dioxygenase-like lactoylglutathione lyase family enzyme
MGTVSSITGVPPFNHVGLCVTDRHRSRRFYEEVLGFVHASDLEVPDGVAAKLLRVPEPVGMTAVYLQLDGFTLELLEFARDGNAPQRERSFTEPGLTHRRSRSPRSRRRALSSASTAVRSSTTRTSAAAP